MKNETPTHVSWRAMISRCTNRKHCKFSRYGGRGIKVCRRWLTFDKFQTDMGERPDGMTLDRFPNNDGNYEPGNCRWATPKQQARQNAKYNGASCSDCRERKATSNGRCHRCEVYFVTTGEHRPSGARKWTPRSPSNLSRIRK